MSERDDRLPEQFLVDGVAPSVIGGDPRAESNQEPEYHDPPTAPIPAAERAAQNKQKKSWFSRVFSPRSSR